MSDPKRHTDPVSEAVARLLNWGTLVSVGLVALGVALLVAAGIVPIQDRGPQAVAENIVGDLLNLHAAGPLWLGLLITVALPTARVALAVLGFARTGDRRAMVVAAGVLAVLLVAFAVAVLTR